MVKQNNNMNNNKNMNKMANFSFITSAHTSFFSLDTNGPIFIAKNHQRIVFSWWILFKVDFRCVQLGFLQKTSAIPIMNPLWWFMIHVAVLYLVCVVNWGNTFAGPACCATLVS